MTAGPYDANRVGLVFPEGGRATAVAQLRRLKAVLPDGTSMIQAAIAEHNIPFAMKLVAAAKLRRAQERIVEARPYCRAMDAMVSDLVRGPLREMHPLLREGRGDGLHPTDLKARLLDQVAERTEGEQTRVRHVEDAALAVVELAE